MSGEREGAHLRVLPELPPLTEEEQMEAARIELARIGRQIRSAVLDRTPPPEYDEKSNPYGGNAC